MPAYLLDTSVIIDYLRGKQQTVDFINVLFRGGFPLGCCAINITEVYAGMVERERSATEEFLESLEYYPIQRSTAKIAGDYKREHAKRGIVLATTDVTIAAVAGEYNLTLITGNPKDYPVEHLAVLAHKAP